MPTQTEVNAKLTAKKKLYLQAQHGDKELLSFFLKKWDLKIYTDEEIKVLNYLLRRKKMGEAITVRDQGRIIMLPGLHEGEKTPALINWLEDLGEGYFRAGLSYVGGYPFSGGSTEWVIKLDPKEGFIPMFCSLYWDGKDC